MISERTFAESFSTFWSGLLPLLTPSLVQMLNRGFQERLVDDFGAAVESVEIRADPLVASVSAEFAFLVVKLATTKERSVRDVFADSALRSTARKASLERIGRLESREMSDLVDLSEDDERKVLDLADNYERFFSQRAGEGAIEFSPIINGAGFLPACEADISWGEALFEVKTVNRNISGRDIRQLLTYLALQANSGSRRWSIAGFFNPRRGEYHEVRVDDLVSEASGGRTATAVFQDLIQFLGERDAQLDTAF